MRTAIGYVKSNPLQEDLNTIYGVGVFTVEVEYTGDIKNFFLEYADNTPQVDVNGALAMAAQNATDYLNVVKINLYEKLDGKAAKTIAAKNPPVYTTEEVQLTVDWLANQQLPVPGCVQFLALTDGISNIAAAEIVANSIAEYQAYVGAVNAVKTTAQSQVMSAPDVYVAKQIATDANLEMKEI